ncbi:MAG: LysR family transcriptional regulator, partial [Comamonadaceae bacterium]|nr:LysR family transcriptional regulator [Comamonadaceae bacterium]
NGVLVRVGQSTRLEEHFYAITTPHRHRLERLEQLLAASEPEAGGPGVSASEPRA